LATAWLFTHEHLLHILARVRALLPDCQIGLGGPEFMGNNECYLRTHGFINWVFRGEGEHQIPAWLKIYNDPEKWNSITGICYIDKNGHYIDRGNAKVMDFASLRAPEESPFFCRDKAFVQFETARGCFNTCSFCVSGADKPVRYLPLDIVAQRLQGYYEMGIRSIRMLDRTFNGQSNRALQMLDLFASFAGKLTFHLEIHPALLNQQIREKIKSMPQGLLHLEAGIQSLQQDVLTRCHRLGSLSDSLNGLEFLCSLSNIQTHADLIAGLPGYTFPQLVDDIHHLAQLYADEIQLESLKVLPGTRMRNEAQESGIIFSPFPPYEVLRSDGMGVADIKRSLWLSRLIDLYYNCTVWQSVFRNLMLNHSGFLLNYMDMMIQKDLLTQPLSMDRRGLLLYDYCRYHLPEMCEDVSIAWIIGGLPLGKEPAQNLKHLKSCLILK
jgi:Fe-S oxidoreductase